MSVVERHGTSVHVCGRLYGERCLYKVVAGIVRSSSGMSVWIGEKRYQV